MYICGEKNEEEERDTGENRRTRRMGGGVSLSLHDLAPQKKKESGTGELKEAKKEGLRKTNTSHCGAEMLL